MSSVELFNYLRKSLGVIIKKLEEDGVKLSYFNEHKFLPEINVDSRGVIVKVVNGIVWKIKNLGDHPVLYNLDRPVSSTEYGVVPPKSYVVLSRIASSIYIKAPEGQVSNVKVDVLGWS